MNRKILLVVVIVSFVIAVITLGLYIWQYNNEEPVENQQNTQTVVDTPQQASEPQVPPPATAEVAAPSQPKATAPVESKLSAPKWPIQISMTDASAVTVVVNKKHQLPSSYVPSPLVNIGGYQMRSDAKAAADSLLAAANSAGYTLKLISAYRSYSYQKTLYDNYVKRDGQVAADTYSARPGFSEHQLGLVADVGNINGSCDLETCFGQSAAGKWIAANAHNYGFIVRYPSGKEAETGYQYEPWHLRYLGVDVAKSVYASGKTLDQYYNVPAGGYE